MVKKPADKKVLRLLDANLNRCREGLRVVEDTVRFVFEDERLYKQVRTLRHRIDAVTRELYLRLLEERDSRADAGRTIKEGPRPDLFGVLAANFRRAGESLRVLEEYSRMIAPALGPEIKKVRFAVYTLEKKILTQYGLPRAAVRR